tara:strand:+ start:716 stop:949 length:234 start_codon:yes stop_codon:yes gene_type:complete
MKTKFKSFLTLSLACIGLVSLLLSASGNLSNNPQNEVGAYQIATMSDSGILYRLDTRTGDIVRIKKSNIPKVDLYKK